MLKLIDSKAVQLKRWLPGSYQRSTHPHSGTNPGNSGNLPGEFWFSCFVWWMRRGGLQLNLTAFRQPGSTAQWWCAYLPEPLMWWSEMYLPNTLDEVFNGPEQWNNSKTLQQNCNACWINFHRKYDVILYRTFKNTLAFRFCHPQAAGTILVGKKRRNHTGNWCGKINSTWVFEKILRPYFFYSLCGIIAFAPISFMLGNEERRYRIGVSHQSLYQPKYPAWRSALLVQYLGNGVSTAKQPDLEYVQHTTGVLFSVSNYNIYTLHIEFLFFILLSGWGMFYLLKRFVLQMNKWQNLLAICYMLSGFMVGSTQWLLYITAAAFIPLLLAAPHLL